MRKKIDLKGKILQGLSSEKIYAFSAKISFASTDYFNLFPLNCANGLGGGVQADAVDAFYFVGDAVGDFVQNSVGDLFDGSGHGVNGIDSTDDGGPTLVTLTIADTDALKIGNSNEVLPDVVQAVIVKLLTQDGISLPQSCLLYTSEKPVFSH